jgi:hypothetical protein
VLSAIVQSGASAPIGFRLEALDLGLTLRPHEKGSRPPVDAAVARLRALVERPRGVVTRASMRRRLWGEHVFVDLSMRSTPASRRLRTVLRTRPAARDW